MKLRLIKDLGIIANKSGSISRRRGIYECPTCTNHFEADTRRSNSGEVKCCKKCGYKKITGENSKLFKHGLSGTLLYSVWGSIIQRCRNPNNKAYKDYGGRGVSICDEWLEFNGFYKWAKIGYKEGLTIERINNDAGYCEANCKWIPMSEQPCNQRLRWNSVTGYKGVSVSGNSYQSRVSYKKKVYHIGSFSTAVEAAKARDDFIVKNQWPHSLNSYTEETAMPTIRVGL